MYHPNNKGGVKMKLTNEELFDHTIIYGTVWLLLSFIAISMGAILDHIILSYLSVFNLGFAVRILLEYSIYNDD